MQFSNFHTHTRFCDGSSEPERYIKSAIRRKFEALGFSAHAPLPFSNEWSLKQENAGAYIDAIRKLSEKYREKIKVYLSLEMDFIPGITEDFSVTAKQYGLDYTLGGIHLVKSPDSDNIWFIDGPSVNYDNGLRGIFNMDIRKAVGTYYTQLQQMIENQKPQVVAHFDKIKMHNRNRYFTEQDAWYRKHIEETAECLARSGCIAEVNTRGLYTGRYRDFYPGAWVLDVCRSFKIPLTLSADAHRPWEVSLYFNKALKAIRKAGYTEIMVFEEKNWVPREI